jgi:hypothetical protein
MSKVLCSQWPGNPFALYPRARMSCGYETYVPDLLAGRAIRLDGDVAADVAEAEAAIRELNARAFALADTSLSPLWSRSPRSPPTPARRSTVISPASPAVLSSLPTLPPPPPENLASKPIGRRDGRSRALVSKEEPEPTTSERSADTPNCPHPVIVCWAWPVHCLSPLPRCFVPTHGSRSGTDRNRMWRATGTAHFRRKPGAAECCGYAPRCRLPARSGCWPSARSPGPYRPRPPRAGEDLSRRPGPVSRRYPMLWRWA